MCDTAQKCLGKSRYYFKYAWRLISLTTMTPNLDNNLGSHNAKNPLHVNFSGHAVVVLGCIGCRPGEHWYLPAGIPATRRRARLPGLLRTATGCKLLFLRRYVLGLPE